MAEVNLGSVVAPEKDELNDDNISKSSAGNEETLSNGRSSDARTRRASAGSMRSSAEKSESGNSSQKVVSRYLRASTGSCHDLCKFGHSTETKEKKPFRKRSGKHLTKLSPDEIPVEILVSGGKKKKEVVASGGRKKEEVVLDGHRKAEKKEEAVSGVQKKEDVVLDGMVSGVQKKEEVVLDGQKKAEKKEEVVSGEQEKEEVVLGVQKEDEQKEEAVSGGQKKEEVVIGEPSIDMKDQSTDHKPSPDAKSLSRKPKTSLAKEKATKEKPSNSPNVPSPRSKTNLIKPSLSTLTKMHSSKKNDSAVSKSLLPKFKPPSAKRSPSADPPEIVKSVCFPYTEVEDLVKQGSLADGKTSRTAKKTTSVVKQKSSPVKLKPVKVKPSSPSDDSGGMHGKGRTDNNAETGRKSMTAKASAKKVLAPPTATLSPKLSFKKTAQINSGKSGNLKLVSPVKDRSRIRRVNGKESNSEKVTEKTLHVVAVETRNSVVSESIRGSNAMSSPQSPLSADSLSHGKKLSSSSQEDNSGSEESAVVTDKATSKNSGSLRTGKEAPVKESPKKTTIRKNRVAVPEDNKHASPVKMKFRMGKVMELQTDDNSPRRLRFRRARVLGLEEIKGDSRRRTSRKAATNADTASAGNTSQKVVLKHQNVQGKKDAQGLLNNVIEQTASKLAESRKSKVKALVGAFETVISLQETKPPTQVVT